MDTMELKQLCKKTLEIFGIKNIEDLSGVLMNACRENDTAKMQEFVDSVHDLSVDWLQKIFQYYEADRTEKKQDFTPKSLSEFIAKLVGDDTEIIDMCAGSGALAIQKWNQNHDVSFQLYEIDEQVIPYLIFNMMIRNIECSIFHSDVLQNEIYHTYYVHKGKQFGEFWEVKECQA